MDAITSKKRTLTILQENGQTLKCAREYIQEEGGKTVD